jgi:hypothetical protein
MRNTAIVHGLHELRQVLWRVCLVTGVRSVYRSFIGKISIHINI